MWKRSLVILFLLFTSVAQAVYYDRTDCGGISSPNEGDVCSSKSTTGIFLSGHLYIYRSAGWHDVDTAGSGTIGGTIAADQVAYGASADVIAGDNNFKWVAGTQIFSILGTQGIGVAAPEASAQLQVKESGAGTAAATTGAANLLISRQTCTNSGLSILATDFSTDVGDGFRFDQCGAGFAFIGTGTGNSFSSTFGQSIQLDAVNREMRFQVAGERHRFRTRALITPGESEYSTSTATLSATPDSGAGTFHAEYNLDVFDPDTNGTERGGYGFGMDGTVSGGAIASQNFYIYDYNALAAIAGHSSGGPWQFAVDVDMQSNVLFAPFVIGGSGTGSTLLLQSTTGVGATDSVVIKTGTNGSNTALTANTSGTITVPSLTASRLVATDASKVLTSTITSANLASSVSDETGAASGSPLAVFNQSPAIASPIISGTAAAAGQLGYNATSNQPTVYDGVQAAELAIPRVVATLPNESKTNSTTSDQDFSTVATIKANFLRLGKVVKVSLLFQTVQPGTSRTIATYLKLGSTKTYTFGTAATFGTGVTRSMVLTYYIFGTADPGASVNVNTAIGEGSFLNNPVAANSTAQPVALATNGDLAVVPGVAFGATGSDATWALLSAMIEYY